MERMEGQANCDALLTALLAATCNAADLDVIGGGRASVEAELRLGAIDVEEDLRLKLFLHGSSCCSLHVGEEKKMGVREKRMGGRERREKMFWERRGWVDILTSARRYFNEWTGAAIIFFAHVRACSKISESTQTTNIMAFFVLKILFLVSVG
jgi:hypothetical protein